MNLKSQSLWGLFIVLIVILAVNPRIVNNIYSSIIGRLLLICVIIFFTMNNTTLGLLVALAIISSLNQFGSFVEGMEPMDSTTNTNIPTTIGEDNVDSTGTTQVLTKSATKKLSEIKEDIAQGQGVDKESIKQTLMSRPSNSIPTSTNMTSSSEVSAAPSGMLSDSKLEGFTSYASVN